MVTYSVWHKDSLHIVCDCLKTFTLWRIFLGTSYSLPPIFELRPVVDEGGVGVVMDCVGERRGFTGDTAAASGTGEDEAGVGVEGLLLPPTFCGRERNKITRCSKRTIVDIDRTQKKARLVLHKAAQNFQPGNETSINPLTETLKLVFMHSYLWKKTHKHTNICTNTHTLHTNTQSHPLTVTCVFLACLAWESMWDLRLVDWANRLLQLSNGHTYGRSPVWIRMCVRRLKSKENLLPQPSNVHWEWRHKGRLTNGESPKCLSQTGISWVLFRQHTHEHTCSTMCPSSKRRI